MLHAYWYVLFLRASTEPNRLLEPGKSFEYLASNVFLPVSTTAVATEVWVSRQALTKGTPTYYCLNTPLLVAT